MSAENEELYTAVLSAVHSFIQEFNRSIEVCEFEKAARNAFKTISLYNHLGIDRDSRPVPGFAGIFAFCRESRHYRDRPN